MDEWGRTIRWARVVAVALVATTAVAGVATPAGAHGAHGAHGRGGRQEQRAHAEWPRTTRCETAFVYVDAYQPPTRRQASNIEVRFHRAATGEPGCPPTAELHAEGRVTAHAFWVAPDGTRGYLDVWGRLPCTGTGCPSATLRVRLTAWLRLDPTSTAGPFGAVAYGHLTVNGHRFGLGRSDNSETTLSVGPI